MRMIECSVMVSLSAFNASFNDHAQPRAVAARNPLRPRMDVGIDRGVVARNGARPEHLTVRGATQRKRMLRAVLRRYHLIVMYRLARTGLHPSSSLNSA